MKKKIVKKKKKKGFTLIELLAVILILGVIALIAVPVVTDVIESAKKSALEQSVKNYISEVNTVLTYSLLKGNVIPDGTYTVEELTTYGVTMKGKVPNGSVIIEGSEVKGFSFLSDGFIASEENGNIVINKHSNFEVSSYVYFEPTLSEYKYLDNTTINPKELTLYRIIKKNSDGSYDAISEYISTATILLGGKWGYLNSVGVLNSYASAYKNDSITVSTRCPGYINQTEFIEDNDVLGDFVSELSDSEREARYENIGGGDYNDWKTDTNLINEVYGTYLATMPNDTVNNDYWIASRSFINNSGRIKRTLENTLNDGMYEYRIPSGEGWYSLSIRPIVTIKATVVANAGDGTKENPYVLE